jgi:hypothetical protein
MDLVVVEPSGAMPHAEPARDHARPGRARTAAPAAGAWPELPAAAQPGAAPAGEPAARGDLDPWPALPAERWDESADADDGDPEHRRDHRRRLEREQRGLPWNA